MKHWTLCSGFPRAVSGLRGTLEIQSTPMKCSRENALDAISSHSIITFSIATRNNHNALRQKVRTTSAWPSSWNTHLDPQQMTLKHSLLGAHQNSLFIPHPFFQQYLSCSGLVSHNFLSLLLWVSFKRVKTAPAGQACNFRCTKIVRVSQMRLLRNQRR